MIDRLIILSDSNSNFLISFNGGYYHSMDLSRLSKDLLNTVFKLILLNFLI